jgi:hypothetical protein
VTGGPPSCLEAVRPHIVSAVGFFVTSGWTARLCSWKPAHDRSTSDRKHGFPRKHVSWSSAESEPVHFQRNGGTPPFAGGGRSKRGVALRLSNSPAHLP